MIQCTICQIINDDQSRFCAECGARLGPPQGGQQSPQPGQQAPQQNAPPQQQHAQHPQQAPLPHPGNRLQSPLLGGNEGPAQPGTDLDRLRKMQGKGQATEGGQPPAPPENAPRKLRSPLLASEEFDDQPEDYPPQPPSGKRLHSPLLGEGGGGGYDPGPAGGGGAPGKRLHSPLLGDTGAGSGAGYEDYYDEPAPQGGGRMSSPLLGGGSGGGKFRSPLLSGAAQGQGGANFEEYYDDEEAVDEDDPNILRSPLLSARTRRPAGAAPGHGQPGHASGQQPPTPPQGQGYPPQPGYPQQGGYPPQPGPQGYPQAQPQQAAQPGYPPQPGSQAYPSAAQQGGYPPQAALPQPAQPGLPTPGQPTPAQPAQPQMPPQPPQGGYGKPAPPIPGQGQGWPAAASGPPEPPKAPGGFGDGFGAGFGSPQVSEAPIPGLYDEHSAHGHGHGHDQDATSDVLPGFPAKPAGPEDEAFPDMTQFRRGGEPDPITSMSTAPVTPSAPPVNIPPVLPTGPVEQSATPQPAIQDSPKPEKPLPQRRPSKMFGGGGDEPEDSYDDQPFTPSGRAGVGPSYGPPQQQAPNPLPKILGGVGIMMALAKLPAVMAYIPYYMSPGQNPMFALDQIVTVGALLVLGIGLITTRN